MNRKSIGSILLPFALLLFALVACNKDSVVSTDDLVDESLYVVQERGGIGQNGCFELVFPVTFTLPDDSQVTANSYDEMKDALRAYFEANGVSNDGDGFRGRKLRIFSKIDFVYPISVLNADGELITLESRDELFSLKKECFRDKFGSYGTHGHGDRLKCFTLNFPLTIAFPDGSTADAADRMALRTLLRTWKQNNPGPQTARPTLVFPISVTMDDGTVVDVASKDELWTLKESCE